MGIEVKFIMKCPICNHKTITLDVRASKKGYTTYRRLECVECLTQFKTTEIIIFDSLPVYLREKHLNGGYEMKRPKISEMVLGVISTLIDSQDEKGMKKYGESIDDAQFDEDGNEYDWNVMALEEMVDGMKYMMKENEKLRKNNQWLEKKLRDERYQRMVLEKGLDRG
jgi:hypothetical protein